MAISFSVVMSACRNVPEDKLSRQAASSPGVYKSPCAQAPATRPMQKAPMTEMSRGFWRFCVPETAACPIDHNGHQHLRRPAARLLIAKLLVGAAISS